MGLHVITAGIEAWHEVGSAGNPAFGTGFANIGAGFNTAAFRKDAQGRVFLKGIVISAANQLAFTLPVGYRPPNTIVPGSNIGGSYSYVTIEADGAITFPVAPSVYATLDDIEFFAA